MSVIDLGTHFFVHNGITLWISLSFDKKIYFNASLTEDLLYLVDGIDRFHDLVFQKLKVAKFDRVVGAVVLQVLVVGRLDEDAAGAGDRVPVHVRCATIPAHRVVSGRSVK